MLLKTWANSTQIQSSLCLGTMLTLIITIVDFNFYYFFAIHLLRLLTAFCIVSFKLLNYKPIFNVVILLCGLLNGSCYQDVMWYSIKLSTLSCMSSYQMFFHTKYAFDGILYKLQISAWKGIEVAKQKTLPLSYIP